MDDNTEGKAADDVKAVRGEISKEKGESVDLLLKQLDKYGMYK